MPKLNQTFSNGLVTARDPALLKDGEVSVATGCEYRPGSPCLHKQLGRSTAATGVGSGSLQAIQKAQYDTASDILIAVTGGAVWESAVSTAPVFAATGLSGLSTSALYTFGAMADRWTMCNGVDANYIREGGAIPGGSTGNWRPNGMLSHATAPTVSLSAVGGTVYRPNGSTGTWTDPANAYDSDLTTFSYASTTRAVPTYTQTWTFGSNSLISGGFVLYVRTENVSKAVKRTGGIRADRSDFEDTSENTLKIEYTWDSGTNWTTLLEVTGTYDNNEITVNIPGATTNTSTIEIRATTTLSTGYQAYSRVYDIRTANGNATPQSITNDIYYTITERYYDSNNQLHDTDISESAIVKVTAASFVNKYAALLTIAPKINAFTKNFVVWRTLDEPGGGYPNFYKVAEFEAAASGTTAWTDDFTSSLTSADDKKELYNLLEILYYTGETLQIGRFTPPPKAKLSLPFQSCMTYIPVDIPRRLYYSLPASISNTAIEQVPTLYFLEFTTPKNDTITSAATANGGNSLLVFFQDYTMLVSALPQATDPSVFDNRIKEYVSNTRGASGVLAVEEFTVPSGETFVAACDSLGVWVTNGVTKVLDWTRDLNWATLMSGVDLSTADLRDNPVKRRIEMLYLDASGAKKALHFYYGRMKQDSDGGEAALITGPHPRGYTCSWYGQVGVGQHGFTGGTAGQVYLEEGQDADASNGYDSNGTIPYDVGAGDIYATGLGGAHIVEEAFPKFETGTKAITVEATFIRDAGTTVTVTKTFNIGTQKKIWWHRYADRHRVRFKDYTATALPALIGYEAEVRDAGSGRDK